MAPEPDTKLLNASQRRIVGFALTLLALLGSLALIVWAFIMLGRLVGFFSGVIWPLAVAAVLALILRPVIAIVQERLRLRRTIAVIALYGVFSLLVVAVLVAVLPPLVSQAAEFVDNFGGYWRTAEGYAELHYPQWVDFAHRQLANPTMRKIADGLVAESKTLFSHAMPTLQAAGGTVLGVFAFTAHVAIVPVYLFFFLLASGEPTKNLAAQLPFLSPDVREDVVFLVREFVSIVEAFFRGQLLIGILMGVLLALGFTFIGLKSGLLIGLTLGLLNIVPYLGTILGLAVALPLAFFQPGGGWRLVGLVLLVKIVVQTIEGWFLTPRIMGSQTGLHPVTIIVAIFFWGTAFGGVLGMLLAIPLTAFIVTVWRLAKRKYLGAPDA